MKKHLASLAVILCLAFSGGCAVVPALVTTGASFAVPQTASLVITAASTVHKTVLIAADERDADDMLSDKFHSIQAQALLMTEPQADMEASCYNGDIYLTGEFATPADRDRIIARMQEIKGVHAVKGVIKQQPTDMLAAINPAVTDRHTEAVIETGLLKELNIRSANVDVEVVQGEAVVMGVVRDKEEEAHVLDVVRGLLPKSSHTITVTSLLALQDAYETDSGQENEAYALLTRDQMRAQPQAVAQAEPAVTTPVPPVADLEAGGAEPQPKLAALYARYFPEKPRSEYRHGMKNRILKLAKTERDPRAKRELITLSSKVLRDRNTSVQDRLVKTLCTTENTSVWNHVDALLDDIAPERMERIATLAMN